MRDSPLGFSKLLFVAIVVGLTLVAGGAIWWVTNRRPAQHSIRNVVLISLDTCRADRLSCYGFSRKNTPNIDAVAEEGVLFENVISPCPLTFPAHSSMLTGTIPPYHGVHDNVDYELNESNTTLAEILSGHGFATGAIVSAYVLDSTVKLDQGFGTYDDEFDEPLNPHGILERRAEEVSRHGIRWLEEHHAEQFFLFLHYYDPHSPYEPPEPFATEYSEQLYAGEIAYVDHCIGQVIDKLKALGLYDSTLLIITGDHGEMLGEHGEQLHAYFIYQGAIKVPLILKLPGQDTPRRVEQVVGLVDLVPTICELLAIEAPQDIQGLSLSEFFDDSDGPLSERTQYSESLTPTKYGRNSLLSLATRSWKFIQTTRPELYDLLNDPMESDNLVDREPRQAQIMADQLKQLLASLPQDASSGQTTGMSQVVKDRMGALGYVSVGVEEKFEFDSSKPEPKDAIALHNSVLDLSIEIHQQHFGTAKQLCEKILLQWPEFTAAYLYRAQIASELKDYASAVANFRELAERTDVDADVLYQFGKALSNSGERAQAIAKYRQALETDPDHLHANLELGVLLLKRGQRRVASEHFDRALQQQDLTAAVHAKIAHTYQQKGMRAEATQHFRDALELDPDHVEGNYNLGTILIAQGKLEPGMQCLNRVLEIDPSHVEAHTNLGNAYQMLRNLQMAVSHYHQALEHDPDHVKAHINLGAVSAQQGNMEQAGRHYQRALQLRPQDPTLHQRLGHVLYMQGELDSAIGNYKQALALKSDYPVPHYWLGIVLRSKGETEEALAHLREAVRLKGDWLAAVNLLAWALATTADLDDKHRAEALTLAEQAVAMSKQQSPVALDTLAATYASLGRFEEAVTAAEKSLQLIPSDQHKQTAEQMRARLELYRKRQPYVESLD